MSTNVVMVLPMLQDQLGIMNNGLAGTTSANNQTGNGSMPIDEMNEWDYNEEFYCYHFKVVSCMKRYAHCWTACPYAHPQEKARRRDPKEYPYCAVVCSALKHAGFCAKGDICPYAHNVFEYWLHPSRFRTELCKDGSNCGRRVCFFAHSLCELRSPECLKSRIAESRSASGHNHLESLQYLHTLLIDVVKQQKLDDKPPTANKPQLLQDLSKKMKQYKLQHPIEMEVESANIEHLQLCEDESEQQLQMLVDIMNSQSSTSALSDVSSDSYAPTQQILNATYTGQGSCG